ncbi:hypothetical protein AYO38_08855 [bacterium SCGC AG-212-C10]|nr:hypothetical protein AYO38_08855 [bacterium SCGC AG-212-C10]
MSDCIVETTGGVMLIRFNRPERLNAMGGTMLQEMGEALDAGQKDDSVRAFVVTGEGRAWCSGADLAAMGGPRPANAPGPRATAVDRAGFAGEMVMKLQHCDKPTIAAVNGVAVGGGLGLVTSFDIRIASEQARFSTIFIKRALAPDFALSWFLPRLVGPEHAAELFFSGRMVSAQEAKEIGLVSKVVPHDQLLEVAMEQASAIAKQPPTAVTLTRRALQRAQTNSLEEHLEFEWANQKTCLASAEFKEGVAAFMEKREPDYSRF